MKKFIIMLIISFGLASCSTLNIFLNPEKFIDKAENSVSNSNKQIKISPKN